VIDADEMVPLRAAVLLDVDRLGRRTYVVRIPEEGGDLPELAQCEVVERLAAKRALDLGVGRGTPQAD